MTTTRRDFIRTTTGADLAGLLLPSWLLPHRLAAIDLAPFCADNSWRPRYDLTKPFRQGEFIYATDSRIALRLGGEAAADLAGEAAKLPTMAQLPFPRDETGWRPVSDLQRTVRESAYGIDCPACDGKGRVGAGVVECRRCDDAGDFGCGAYCTGWAGGVKCLECSGSGDVHWCYELDGEQFAPALVHRLRALPGCEVKAGAHVRNLAGVMLPDPLNIKFDGGVGLMMGLIRG